MLIYPKIKVDGDTILQATGAGLLNAITAHPAGTFNPPVYGKPIAIKLRHKIPVPELNIATYTQCFEPEDIEEIYECEEVEELRGME